MANKYNSHFNKKFKKGNNHETPKLRPPFHYNPPYPSMCYREGPNLELVAVPPVSSFAGHLKCSRCKKLPPLESIQCTLGHIICPTCFEAVPSCPKRVYSGISGTNNKVLCGRGFSTSSVHWAHRLFLEDIRRPQPIEDKQDDFRANNGSQISSYSCAIQ